MNDSSETSIISDGNVGIVVALPEELATLTRQKLVRGQPLKLGHCWIIYSGAGQDNAARAAKQLLEKGVDGLISWGCAAGLADDMKPGDLALASQVLTDGKQYSISIDWHSEVLRRLQDSSITLHAGKLFTSTKLIDRSEEKKRIRQGSQAIALDMESAAIAEVAKLAGLPFLVIRSVADPASADLPGAISASLDNEGQVELARLLRHLLRHPLEVIGLIRLGLHFHAAQKTLKTVARQLGITGATPAL
ncbi:MAG: phosphorylase family protein [Gammaproteobacteria bacterium]